MDGNGQGRFRCLDGVVIERLITTTASRSHNIVFLPGQEHSQRADNNIVPPANDRQCLIDRMLQIAVDRNNLRETERVLSDGRCETPTLQSQQEALYEASKLGYAPLVECLLQGNRTTKLDVNAPTVKKLFSPLQAASASGHEPVVKMLLDAGADPNLVGGKYGTALQAAAFNGRINVIRLLLSREADVNQCGGQDSYPLQAAVGQGRRSTTALLLNNGASVLLLPEGLRIRAKSLAEEAGEGVH
jgi:ankyrin repeat protein